MKEKEIILEGLRLGKPATEIEKCTTVKAQQINKIKKQLIKEGIITQKEIDEAKERAKIEKERNRLQKDPYIQRMLEYGVRIDIWTHFMRECIINYVH